MVESALIFEADAQGSAPGWRQRFDRIVLVTAPDEVKIARYVTRMSQGAPSARDLEADARSRLPRKFPIVKRFLSPITSSKTMARSKTLVSRWTAFLRNSPPRRGSETFRIDEIRESRILMLPHIHTGQAQSGLGKFPS